MTHPTQTVHIELKWEEVEALRGALVHALNDRDFTASRPSLLHLVADEKLRAALSSSRGGREPMSEHQDSSKVPEAEKLTICVKCGEPVEISILGCFRDPNIGHGGPFCIETYIPISALLSDEVVEAVKRRWFDAAQEFHGDENLVVRALLQAAIDQLGGPDVS